MGEKKISIKSFNKKEGFMLPFDETTKVGDIRRRVAEKENLSSTQIHLVMKGKPIPDESDGVTLESLGA